MRFFIQIVLLLVITLPFSTYAATKKRDTTILLFGDSLIAGYKLPKESSIPFLLEKELRKKYKINVINGGITGNTSTHGKERLESLLREHQPDMVFVALGGNDLLKKAHPKLTFMNLDAILRALQYHKTPAILSAVKAPASMVRKKYKEHFDKIYSELAEKYNIPLYPFLITNTYGKPTLMQSDTIHPNAEGNKVIAQELAKYFIESIFQKKR